MPPAAASAHAILYALARSVSSFMLPRHARAARGASFARYAMMLCRADADAATALSRHARYFAADARLLACAPVLAARAVTLYIALLSTPRHAALYAPVCAMTRRHAIDMPRRRVYATDFIMLLLRCLRAYF